MPLGGLVLFDRPTRSSSSHGRQFTRAYTKVEQIYDVGACDF